MAEVVFERKISVDRFHEIPNAVAPDLERILGINFEDSYPAMITMDFLTMTGLLKDDSDQFIKQEVLRRRGKARAFYDKKYDACFFYPGQMDQRVAMHENLHGYLMRQDPKLAFGEEEFFRRISVDPEQTIVYHCCGEGLAELGTIMAFQEEGKYPDAADIEEDLLHTNGYTTVEYALQTKGMQRAFAHLEKGLTKFQQVQRRRGIVRYLSEHRTFLQLEQTPYSVGYLFSKFAVQELRAMGMNFPDAYKFLAQNIPSTIEELKHPVEYAHALLAR